MNPSKLSLVLASLMAAPGAYADQLVKPDLGAIKSVQKGSESQIQRCLEATAEFVSQEQSRFLNQSCASVFSGRAGHGAVKASDDGMMSVAGFRNVLFIKRKGASGLIDGVITGSNSGLGNILSISIDSRNEEIFVLNQIQVEGETLTNVLSFSAKYNGNVSPFRTLQTDALSGASSLLVDPANDEIYVANPKSKSILVFKRTANREGSGPKYAQDVQRRISSPMLVHPQGLALGSAKQELYVLDHQEGRVMAFPRLGDGQVAPLRVIEGGGTEILKPEALSFSASKGELHVINGDGSLLRFPASASGNIAPLAP